MAACASAIPATFSAPALPHVRTGRRWRQRSRFGDLALAAFLLTQCLDGILTYLGVAAFGLSIEANPIVAALMTHLGHGVGLLSAKVAAGALGVCLHFHEIHAVVALLAGFYLTAAVAPWTFILFF